MSQSILFAFGITLLAGLATCVGSLFTIFTHHTNKRAISLALGFSAGVMIFYWFDAYGDFMKEVRENVDAALGLAFQKNNGVQFTKTQTPQRFSFSLIQTAHAEAPIAEPTAEELAQYTGATNSISLFESMEEMNGLLQEVFLEDENLKSVQENLSAQKQLQQQVIDSLPPSISMWKAQEPTPKTKRSAIDELDEDGDGEVTLKDVTGKEWGAMGAVLVVGLLILWGIIKLVKRIFRRRK